MRYFKVIVADETFMIQIPPISDPNFIVKTLFGEEATFEEVSKEAYETFEGDIETEVDLKAGDRDEEP